MRISSPLSVNPDTDTKIELLIVSLCPQNNTYSDDWLCVWLEANPLALQSSQVRLPVPGWQLHCTGQLLYRSAAASLWAPTLLRYVTSDWLYSQGPACAGELGKLCCSSCSSGRQDEGLCWTLIWAPSSRLWGWSREGQLGSGSSWLNVRST